METYEIVCHTNDTDWLEHRLSGIGASEMAAVLGLSKWATPIDVYVDKTGGEPREVGEAAEWGHRLEEPILIAFSERSGLTCVYDGNLLRSKEHPWCLATLDAYTMDGDTMIPVEIKTGSIYTESDWENGVPETYRAQIHQQMLVTGAPHAYIACLIGGQRLMWSKIERDETLIKRIIRAGSAFWQRVQDRDPPPAESPGDKAALGRLYPEDNGETVELSLDVADLIEGLEGVKAEIRALKKKEETLAAKIQEALGDNTAGHCANGWSVTWKTQERASHTVKASKSRVLRISKPRKSKAA